MTADDVEEAFRRLLPPEVRVVACAIGDAPGEWALPPDLARARTIRQREFIAGRWCATRALAQLGVTGVIGRRTDRAPAWPIGATGSITHTRAFAAAAVTRSGAIGIDLEPRLTEQALADVRQLAIDDAEWRVLGADGDRATAVFSAKESIFKARFPLDGIFLEFQDAKLKTLEADGATFDVRGADVVVRWCLADGHAFTALVDAAPPHRP